MRTSVTAGAFGVGIAALAAVLLFAVRPRADDQDTAVDRGRYLVKIAGCNDCHTAGYAPSGGQVEESRWLTGDAVGFQGPWGTTYPINLRLFIQNITEEQWLVLARSKPSRPPMPWFALRDMSEEDLRAVYRFVRSLGPAGEPSPEYLPPGVEATTPVVRFP